MQLERTVSLDRPLFIVAAPRSGGSMLVEAFARACEFFTVGGESHDANALRIPSLKAAFPEARFIYVYRDPRETIASIIEAWKSGRFVTHPELSGWRGPPWSFVLISDWRKLAGKELIDIAVAQWERINKQIIEDLASLSADTWTATTYKTLTAKPARELARLARFGQLAWDDNASRSLPLTRHALTPPDPNKWRAHELSIVPRMATLADTNTKAKLICATAIETP